MQNKSLVIIPTFNEAGNIQKMIHAIIGLKEKVDILVIDDASPDGTAQIVRDQKVMYPGRVHLLVNHVQNLATWKDIGPPRWFDDRTNVVFMEGQGVPILWGKGSKP